MLLCFIDPRVRKIKNEAFRCPGIFSRTLRFYSFASSPCSPWLQHSATHCYTQPMGPTNVLWAGPRSINPLNYLKKMILTYDLWLMIYILHQQDRVPIMIWSTKSCLLRIFLHKFFLRRILFTKKILLPAHFLSSKNLACGAFDFSVLLGLPIHWYWKWFEFKNSVITTSQFVKKTMKKVSKNKKKEAKGFSVIHPSP